MNLGNEDLRSATCNPSIPMLQITINFSFQRCAQGLTENGILCRVTRGSSGCLVQDTDVGELFENLLIRQGKRFRD